LLNIFFVAPAPPQNFNLITNALNPVRTFSWTLYPNSEQDRMYIRFCLKINPSICLLEKEVPSFLSLKITISPKLPLNQYVVYAFTQSRGINSSHSNIVSFTKGKS